MSSIALSILALAAGVYLLIQVKNLGLGFIYKLLSWLVVLLALGFILCGVARAGMHMRHERQCHAEGRCGMGMGHGGGACPYMQTGCCLHGGGCTMGMSQNGCTENKSCCGEMKECGKKEGEGCKSSCCAKGAEKEMSACCKKAAADSTAKK